MTLRTFGEIMKYLHHTIAIEIDEACSSRMEPFPQRGVVPTEGGDVETPPALQAQTEETPNRRYGLPLEEVPRVSQDVEEVGETREETYDGHLQMRPLRG